MPSGRAECVTLTLPRPPTVLHSSVLPESDVVDFIMNHMKAALTDRSESAFPILIQLLPQRTEHVLWRAAPLLGHINCRLSQLMPAGMTTSG